MIVPVLLSELAPDEARGMITTMHQLLLTIGILVRQVSALAPAHVSMLVSRRRRRCSATRS